MRGGQRYRGKAPSLGWGAVLVASQLFLLVESRVLGPQVLVIHPEIRILQMEERLAFLKDALNLEVGSLSKNKLK